MVCSLLLQLNKELMDLRVVQLEPTGDGRLLEHPPPATFPDDRPVVLDVYGSLLSQVPARWAPSCPTPAARIIRWWCFGCAAAPRSARRSSG